MNWCYEWYIVLVLILVFSIVSKVYPQCTLYIFSWEIKIACMGSVLCIGQYFVGWFRLNRHWGRKSEIVTFLSNNVWSVLNLLTVQSILLSLIYINAYRDQPKHDHYPLLNFRHYCNSGKWEASSMCPSREWSTLHHQWHRVSSWLARSKSWNHPLWQLGLFHADCLPVYHHTGLDGCSLLGKVFI